MGSLNCLSNALNTRASLREKMAIITPDMIHFETDLGKLDITEQRSFRGYTYRKNPLHQASIFELDLTATELYTAPISILDAGYLQLFDRILANERLMPPIFTREIRISGLDNTVIFEGSNSLRVGGRRISFCRQLGIEKIPAISIPEYWYEFNAASFSQSEEWIRIHNPLSIL